MPRYALRIAYDGGEFCGAVRQAGRRSVTGELEAARQRLQDPGEITVCSRTDAGVHAQAQVAHLDSPRQWQAPELAAALNSQLPADLVVQAAAEVAADFHAAHDSIAKTYCYRFDSGAVANPFLARTSWRAPGLPNLGALQACAQALLGTHDFARFARSGDHRQNHVVTISDVKWEENTPQRSCTICADRFTYRLVRSLVAAQWHVARGRASLQDLQASLSGKTHDLCKQQAPARGLCLMQVAYAEPISWQSPGTGPSHER